MTACGWLWIYAGLGLALLELVVPGFILCFFGLAAATVGVLRLVCGAAFGATAQLAAFSILSVLYIILLRRYLKKVFVGEKGGAAQEVSDDAYVGRTGTVTEAIVPPKTGRVLLGDAEWTAMADAPVSVGADVAVVARKNLTMAVRPI